MSVTPAEVLMLLRGEASAELQTRFLHEVGEQQSQLFQMLKAMEAWGTSKLNPNCPSPPSPPLVAEPAQVMRVVRKAAFWGHEDATSAAVGVNELVEYIRGSANSETVTRLKKVLADPSSDLSQLLKRLENGAK